MISLAWRFCRGGVENGGFVSRIAIGKKRQNRMGESSGLLWKKRYTPGFPVCIVWITLQNQYQILQR